MLPDSHLTKSVPKGKLSLEYLAIGFTIIGGMVALMSYMENQSAKKLVETNAQLEKEIKELQLANLKQKSRLP